MTFFLLIAFFVLMRAITFELTDIQTRLNAIEDRLEMPSPKTPSFMEMMDHGTPVPRQPKP